MKISRLEINNFRGIKSADLLFPKHAVLIGDNNTGKSTIFEALNLVLGPDRLYHRPVVDEHDFYNGDYYPPNNDDIDTAPIPAPQIKIEATITDLNDEQKTRFAAHIEWWNKETNALLGNGEIPAVDDDSCEEALRVCFIGEYDSEEDDFIGQTYFAKSIDENDTRDDAQKFNKKDKQICGFLYLRSLRTGTRALSLERGSLLDIILRIKEIRPQMWHNIIEPLSDFEVAADPNLGITGVLASIETSMKKYVPKEWGISPHLKVSNLTRENLRKIITAFIATGDGNHSAPFYRQGTGTLNILVLAMLSQIAEDKQNVIFAMEEPETAIPPYTQKSIVHEIKNLSSQTFFTSHSPYVIEEFELDETVILSRDDQGVLTRNPAELPVNITPKRYRREFRTNFCEGLLARRILIVEGATEASAIPAVARYLSEIDSDRYANLEALGVCVIDAGGETNIAGLAGFYRGLGKYVFALCDKQSDRDKALIEAQVDQLFMHDENGFEELVLNNTRKPPIDRFINSLIWPDYLNAQCPDPRADTEDALMQYFKGHKGVGAVADFLVQCEEPEIPQWIKDTCIEIKAACDR